jgi:type IV secretory pathway VirD2 relaxase
MTKRMIDLRDGAPLLDIQSLGRATHPPTQAERLKIALTVRRVPEVMVRVTGGARTVAGVKRHMSYIGREGEIELETDMGFPPERRDIQDSLVKDWDLDLDQLATNRSIRDRKPVKLVHNVIFSMPPGTPAEKVLKAVRQLAQNEWQLKHRYAMALHTDQPHPHVHVVLRAISEEGKRLNIRKATLRSWRSKFAENLQELGVAANATERAVRGQIQVSKPAGIHRAVGRGDSRQFHARQIQIAREAREKIAIPDPGRGTLLETRYAVVEGWRNTIARLRANGDHQLADAARHFVDQMPRVQTENSMLRDQITDVARHRPIDPFSQTR